LPLHGDRGPAHALESADEISHDEAAALRENLLEVAKFLRVDDAFTTDERAALAAPLGEVVGAEEGLSLIYGDIPYLLWALGRVSELYAVDDLGPRLGEILNDGIFNVGDRHAIKKALDEAALRSAGEIDAMLVDIARANALLATASSTPSTKAPPASAFYVLPWLKNTTWPWGTPCELTTEIEGVTMTFGIEGIRPA
jgi:hypothetical protein